MITIYEYNYKSESSISFNNNNCHLWKLTQLKRIKY